MYQYFTGGMSGSSTIFMQHQIDPNVLRVLHIANSDPMVMAFCQRYQIFDAQSLYNVLKNEYFNKRVKEMLKGLTPAEIEKLQRENPEYEYKPTTCARLMDLNTENFKTLGKKHPRFEGFHFRETVERAEDGTPTKIRTLYQCRSCGLVIWDHEDPMTLRDRLSGLGHDDIYNKTDFPTSEDCTRFREKQNSTKTLKVEIQLHETLSHGRDPISGIETVEIIPVTPQQQDQQEHQEHTEHTEQEQQ